MFLETTTPGERDFGQENLSCSILLSLHTGNLHRETGLLSRVPTDVVTAETRNGREVRGNQQEYPSPVSVFRRWVRLQVGPYSIVQGEVSDWGIRQG